MTSYDYIIVGAGSAGCVLANRLSEDPAVSVLLIEAGPKYGHPVLQIPMGSYLILRFSVFDWGLHSAPEPELGRTLHLPRGKVAGGTSSINAMYYVRGNRLDFDDWAAMGCAGWNYADTLPYFKRAERTAVGSDAFRGRAGPLNVKKVNNKNPLYGAFMTACESAGIPYNDDYNGSAQDGVSRTQHTLTERNRRCSTAVAYLAPAMSRPNLTVLTNAHVNRLISNGNRIVEVEVSCRGKVKRFGVSGEALVSAGTYMTPQLLMLSGIGPEAELRRHGLPIMVRHEEVGQNLQDHFGSSINQACTKPITFYNAVKPWQIAYAAFQGWFLGRGWMSHFPLDAMAFLRSEPSIDRPDIQMYFAPWTRYGGTNKLMNEHGYALQWCHLHPESRGQISLTSADPRDKPVVLNNFLASDHDLQVHRRAFDIAREVHAQPAFDPYRGRELTPGSQAQSREEIDLHLRNLSNLHYHPVGTARMGADAASVVDLDLKVRGVDNLRVVDASVMPKLIGANTNAATIMIAEKAADLILGRPLLAPEHV